jgi:hypothetical protein
VERRSLGLALLVVASAMRADSAERCADFAPLRNAYWGDLHVHSALSTDAYAFHVRSLPSDAYRFARGEELGLPPLGVAGEPTRRVRIDRPLDFTAVTDHAESLGASHLCTTQDSAVYETRACRHYRALRPVEWPPRRPDAETALTGPSVCGQEGGRCAAAASAPWQRIRDAATAANDACSFTTFVAYEWTGMRPGLIHRNVIFRGDHVPALPVSYADEPTPRGLWRALDRQCLDAGTGCDVLAIPHNSNTSRGFMFALEHPDTGEREEQVREARLRQRLEPLVEIMQHKGDSECRNGLPGVMGAADELCDFEKLFGPELETCEPGKRYAPWEPGCVAPLGYARYGLVEGVKEHARLGVNPLQFGIIASTDNHNAASGAVDEANWPGALGIGDAPLSSRLGPIPRFGIANNPGGLAGIWAEQNTRDALFDAMRRRETFGSSGPRIVPRFFGGWDYPDDLCDAEDWVGRSYAGGVPMGGVLPLRPTAAQGPAFAVAALADPGTPERAGTPLERIQIVKGWADEQGRIHQRVVDVVGAAQSDAAVEAATCVPPTSGPRSLCAVWRDPEFDPAHGAVYYARVLERPSCRWSTHACNALPAAERPSGCSDPEVAKTVRERAWTSPIWYAPGSY